MKHDFIDEHAREQLSALLDGELDGDAQRFLQRRLQHDDALVGQLVRWQLAGDVLRGHARADGDDDDLAGRVRAAIEREQAQSARAKPRRGWMLWGGGLVAAAALGIAALNLPAMTDPASAQAAPQVATATPAPAAATTPASSTAPAAAVATAAAAETQAVHRPVVDATPETAAHRIAEVAPRHRQRDAGAGVTNPVQDARAEVAVVPAPERALAVAATTPVGRTKAQRNPFTMRAAAPQSELPWPKAVLPGFNSGLNADFSSDGADGNPFMPHRAFGEPSPPR